MAKRSGVLNLTPARALVTELVRRCAVLGFECSLLELQKLAWLLERALKQQGLPAPLNLQFKADRYGRYAHRLTHLLDSLDGSYLHCDKRLADAGPLDAIWFGPRQRDRLQVYLDNAEALAHEYRPWLEAAYLPTSASRDLLLPRTAARASPSWACSDTEAASCSEVPYGRDDQAILPSG